MSLERREKDTQISCQFRRTSQLGPAPLGKGGGRVEAKPRLLIEIMSVVVLPFLFVLTVFSCDFQL